MHAYVHLHKLLLVGQGEVLADILVAPQRRGALVVEQPPTLRDPHGGCLPGGGWVVCARAVVVGFRGELSTLVWLVLLATKRGD